MLFYKTIMLVCFFSFFESILFAQSLSTEQTNIVVAKIDEKGFYEGAVERKREYYTEWLKNLQVQINSLKRLGFNDIDALSVEYHSLLKLLDYMTNESEYNITINHQEPLMAELIVNNIKPVPKEYLQNSKLPPATCWFPDKKIIYSILDNSLSAIEASSGRLLWNIKDTGWGYDNLKCIGSKIIVNTIDYKETNLTLRNIMDGKKLLSIDAGIYEISLDKKYIYTEGNFNLGHKIIDIDNAQLIFEMPYNMDNEDLYNNTGNQIRKQYLFTDNSDDQTHDLDGKYDNNVDINDAKLLTEMIENFALDNKVAQIISLDRLDDNTLLVTMSRGGFYVIDLKTGKVQKKALEYNASIIDISIINNGKTIYILDELGNILQINNLQMHIDYELIINTELKKPRHIAVSNDGSYIWVLSNDKILFIDYTNKTKESINIDDSIDIKNIVYDLKTNKSIIIIDSDVKYINQEEPALINSLWNTGNAIFIDIKNLNSYSGDTFFKNYLAYSTQLNTLLFIEPGNSYAGTVSIYKNVLGNTITEKPYTYDQHYLYPYTDKAVLSDDGYIAAILNSDRAALDIFDVETGQYLPFHIPEFIESDHIKVGNLKNAIFIPNFTRLVTFGEDNAIRLWDLQSGDPKLLLSYIFFDNDNYVVIGKGSRFDTSDLDKLEGVHWTASHIPGQTLPLASLSRNYYQPRLAEYVLNGKILPEIKDITQQNLKQHGVRLINIDDEKNSPRHVAVTVELYVRGDDENHPAQDLKLFRDGRLVAQYTGENGGLFELPDGKLQYTFHNIALPQSKDTVKFKAYAFNSDKVRSKYFEKEYKYTPIEKVSPKLHVIAMGVNEFDNSSWNLKYSTNDATGFADLIPKYFASSNNFDVQLLTSGNEYIKPTKNNLKEKLIELTSSNLKSGPDDTVIVTISSHGLTDDKTNEFFIIPADIPGNEKKVTPELLAQSISANELSEWITTLDAKELVLILDTCQSGAALGGETFKPGPMGDKGLGQLAYDKAMRVLTATNENNAAMEIGSMEHGLLSYALLIDGLELGKASLQPGQPFTIQDWLKFGQKDTSDLYAKIVNGENIVESRGKLKVDKTQDNANPPLGQEPYLFDFGGESQSILKVQ